MTWANILERLSLQSCLARCTLAAHLLTVVRGGTTELNFEVWQVGYSNVVEFGSKDG